MRKQKIRGTNQVIIYPETDSERAALSAAVKAGGMHHVVGVYGRIVDATRTGTSGQLQSVVLETSKPSKTLDEMSDSSKQQAQSGYGHYSGRTLTGNAC